MIALALFALMFHHETYSHRVYRQLQDIAYHLDKYKQHPPADSSREEDSMYVTRAECEIVIVQQKLVRYENHQLEKKDVEWELKQLRTAMDDVPAVDDERLKD